MKSTQSCPPLNEESVSEEIEEEQTPCCRICDRQDGDLICPCRCVGACSYVHLKCLVAKADETRILKIAQREGVYNSRCPACKQHIQFQIQDTKVSLSLKGAKEVINSINEDSAASLGLNMSIAILILAIMAVMAYQHFEDGLFAYWGLSCKFFLLESLLLCVFCFLGQNVIQSLPRKISKPVLVQTFQN